MGNGRFLYLFLPKTFLGYYWTQPEKSGSSTEEHGAKILPALVRLGEEESREDGVGLPGRGGFFRLPLKKNLTFFPPSFRSGYMLQPPFLLSSQRADRWHGIS